MIRQKFPGLSAWTLDELGAKMKSDRCGKRPERCYPARGRATLRGLRGAIECSRRHLEGQEARSRLWGIGRDRADAMASRSLSYVLQDFLHLRCRIRAQCLPANVAQF